MCFQRTEKEFLDVHFFQEANRTRISIARKSFHEIILKDKNNEISVYEGREGYIFKIQPFYLSLSKMYVYLHYLTLQEWGSSQARIGTYTQVAEDLLG